MAATQKFALAKKALQRKRDYLVANVGKKEATARVDVSHLECCPICGAPFSTSEANGHRVLSCLKDNVVYPIPDNTLPSQ